MKRSNLPVATLGLVVATVLYSLWVSYTVSGALFGQVKIVQLEEYGALNLTHLANLELWRLVASQLIHVKPLHMVYNALSLLLLGLLIERYVGWQRYLLLWLGAGSMATLLSTFFVPASWNLGTGASQAIFAIAGFGLLLVHKNIERSWALYGVLAFALVPALALDFIFAGYPKPGHMAGLLLGLIFGRRLIEDVRSIS